MTHHTPDHRWTSERTLRFHWPDADAHHPRRAAVWASRLREALPHLEDAVPGVRTLTLIVDPARADPDETEDRARRVLARSVEPDEAPARTVEIPVCFDKDLAPDLHRLPNGAVERFTGATYTVALFGFAPGFAYLDGLPEDLHTPRLDTPRPRIEPGSVAIGGRHAAIYPAPSPGGWNIIGRTHRVMFDPTRDPPALLAPGDAVRFVPITRDALKVRSA